MANGPLSYYDPDEIEDAVCDLLDLNLTDEASTLVRHGLSLHPGNATIEYWAIWIGLHTSHVEEAEKMFEKYKGSDDSAALRLKFTFQLLHGHPRIALQDFTTALREGKVPPADWVNTIEELFDALPNVVLIPFMTEAAELIKDDAESLSRISAILIDTGQFEQAAPILERSLDLNAYDIYSWQDLARCYMLMHDKDKCMEACEYGLAIEADNPLLSFIRGYMLYDQSHYADCIPYLLNARRFAEGKIGARNLNMSDAEIQQQINITYELLGLAYMETEQNEQAKECFDILTERDPSNIQGYMHLASIFLLEGDQNTALNFINQAYSLNPHDESVCSLRISVLTSMHRFDEVIDSLRAAIKLFPRKRTYLIAYAEILRQTDHKQEADTVYRKLLKMRVREKAYRQIMRDYFESIGDNEALEQLKD